MKEELTNVRSEFIALSIDAATKEDLDNLRVTYLGRNGRLTQLIKKLADLPKEEKAALGKLINQTKSSLEETLEESYKRVESEKTLDIDPTMPTNPLPVGHTHLITQAIEDIATIFYRLGFERSRYPEVDWDWYAFEALNFPKNHPARDNWETYWIDAPASKKFGKMLLTPHTSNGQVREMERLHSQPPIRMINIAKCYRRQSDVSHTPMFHQFEGLVVDEGISIAHLKGTLEYFAKNYFGENREIRLRPHDFEFTEPSFEVDIRCDICEGKGCKLCKEGWLELAGAGMVHPNVLKAGGIDPEKYTGFAFGTGVERVLMMRSGLKIDDLRTLYSTDYRYIRQF